MFHNHYQELSKADKKIIQELIQKGIRTEFETGLTAVESMIREWRRDKTDNGETYRKLYKEIVDFNKHIARRYDGLGDQCMFQPLVSSYATGY